MDLQDDGLFIFMGLANVGVSLEKLEKAILQEIEKVKLGKLNEAELQSKTNLRANFLYELESSSGVASLFGSYIVRNDLESLLHFEQDFDSLSLEEIVAVAQKYFVRSNATILTLTK